VVFSIEAGWKESSIHIPLSLDKQKNVSKTNTPTFKIPGIRHRNLLDIIQNAFWDARANFYHLTPFRLFWKPTPNSEPEQVVTDLYNADAYLEEHEKLQQQPREPGCELEWVVTAIMVWSDATHMANFGQASLWPVYVFLRNQSKYSRAKLSNFAVHHLAYIPLV